MKFARECSPKVVDGHEAQRLYEALQDITENGCDAEIKKINGKLKIFKVRKQVASEFEFESKGS